MKNLIEIKGDASFRKFFRKKNNNKTSIIVYAKKEKFRNLLVYDAINKILNKRNILAPIMYKENYNKDYIEIQDFGNQTIFSELKKKGVDRTKCFKKIVILLNKVQSIKDRKIKNFKNRNYTVPKYDKSILLNEANLFCDWYIKKHLPKSNTNKFTKEFKKITKSLVANLKLKNDIFVHRDFHVSNLMFVNNQIGLIDSQDALIGNKAYDLASLIDDVRFKTSKSFKKKIFNFYLKKQKKLNKNKFKNDFEILSVLRNLKIIGIFTRLALRDGKKSYLRLIPYTWKLISLRINENEVFHDLKTLLKKNFKTKFNEN